MSQQTQLLDGIVIFVAVIKQASFTAAANATGHSTSYISKEINKLEERLGVRLLHRTTRTLSLTPEGDLYYQQCVQMIDDMQALQAQLSGHQGEPQGRLKISCPVNFGLSRLKPLLIEFMQRYPRIELDLDLSDRKVDIIGDGYDLVIRASGKLDSSSLISRRLMSSHGVCLAAPSYLQRYGTPANPQALKQHKTICYSNLKQSDIWHFVDQAGQEQQVKVGRHVHTNSSELELDLCKAGVGIIRLPDFYLNGELERGELVELFSDYQRQKIDVFLVYPSRKHVSNKVRCFIDFAVEAFERQS